MNDLIIVKRREGYNLIAKSEQGRKWIKDNVITLNFEVVFINGDATDLAETVDKLHASDLVVEVL